MSSYSTSCSRYSRARQRAAETSLMMRDNSRSLSSVRARSEYHRDSPAGAPSRAWGAPDYRSSSLELRVTSPCRVEGGYLPRWVWGQYCTTATLHVKFEVSFMLKYCLIRV